MPFNYDILKLDDRLRMLMDELPRLLCPPFREAVWASM
jgi:hypothetical protein